MSSYSPQADDLLELWKCISMNMRSLILQARLLQKKAAEKGRRPLLEAQLRMYRVNERYTEIGRRMREILSEDGVQKQFPEPEEGEDDPVVRRYVDFRINEEAIPSISLRLEELNEEVLALFITLCSIRID